MFFLASKVLWSFAAPINILLGLAFLGAILSRGRHGRGARAIAIGAIGLLLILGLLPVGAWLIEPLEDRFPPAPADLAAPMESSCSAAPSIQKSTKRAIR